MSISDVSPMTTNVTTTFSDDSPGQEVSSIAPTNIPSSLLSSTQSLGSQSIIDFLSKPILLTSGYFSSADSNYLYSVNVPSGITSNVLYAKKLSGIAYMRADVVFELRVNATRFQQGRYMMTCVNTGGVYNSSAINSLLKMKHCNLVTKTQLPHVEIDLASETSCVLKVPYISAFNYLSTTSQTINSVVTIWPYSPLEPGSGDSTCAYDLYVHFENIVLSASIVSQSNKRSIAFEEQKKAGTGPVSVFMGQVSRTAGILGRIPLLMPMSMTVGWAADIIGDAAKVWGWSKPTTVNPASLFARQSHTQMTLTDGTFVGHKMGASSLQGVMPHNGVARTNIDELSIDFIKSQFAWSQTIPWSDSAAAGTQLLTAPLCPSAYNTTYGVGRTFTPVAFLTNFFSLYRGGLKFKFKLVKTEFHSGRLMFAFLPVTPTVVLTPPVITLANTDNLVREIVDIRTTNEVELTVPFVADRNYIGSNQCYGHLYVFVMNPLIAPSTVASDIQIIVEVAGADDLVFEQPMSNVRKQVYVPFQSDKTAIAFPTMGASNDSILYPKVSIGEHVNSLRQIIKRAASVGPFVTGANPVNQIQALCFAWVNQATSNVTPVTRVSAGYDFLSLLSGCYAFTNGGVRYSMIPDFANLSEGFRIEINQRADNASDFADTQNFSVFETGLNPLQYISNIVEGAINIEVPYYSQLTSRPTLAAVTMPILFLPQPFLKEDGAPATNLRVITCSLAKPSYLAARSASEDFSFSCWTGVPPLVDATTV